MSAESPAASGLELGRYVLERRIASGGMADVYLARQRGSFGFARSVAVKVLKSDVSGDPEHVRMFLREAMLAADFRHANLAQVYEVGEEGGRLFIAMELVRGVSLATLMLELAKQRRSIPIPLATRIARDALDGLAYAHEAADPDGNPLHVVHRDISPHNILVDVAGTVKVVDFGIARAETRAGRTQGAQIKGKFGYMAPEQWDASRGIDARADLFAMGVVLYEMSTGSRRLFRGQSAPELYRAIVKDTVPPPTLRVHDYPNALAAVVMRALERDPAQRWPSAREMRDALDRVLDAQAWHAATREEVAHLVATALDGRSIEARWEALESGGDTVTTDVDDVALAAVAAMEASRAPSWRPSPESAPAPPIASSTATVSARPSALGLGVDDAPRTPPPVQLPTPPPSAPAASPPVWAGAALAGWLVALALGVTWWRAKERLITLEASGPVLVSPAPPPPREVPAALRVLAEPTLTESVAAPWAELLASEVRGLRVEVDRGSALARMLHGDARIALRAGLADDVAVEEGRRLGLDLRAPASAHVVGHDHAVVVVHPSNPLRSLSPPELAALFAGRVARYRSLHGSDLAPALVVCAAGSPTRAFLDDVVMPQGDARHARALSREAVVVVDEAAAAARVQADPAAVALVRLAWVTPGVRAVPVEPVGEREAVAATRDTIRSGRYPLARPVVVYTRGAPTGEEARLVRLALSPAGQTLVERAGYVSN